MNVLVKRVLIAGVAIGVVGGGYALVTQNGKGKKDEITYKTDHASIGDVRSFVSATGVIQPWKVVDVKSDVAGKIMKLAVDLGTPVKSGQLIALIDPTDSQTALDQADADLASARAKKLQADVAMDQEHLQDEAKIASSRRALEASKAKLAQADASRMAQPQLTKSAIAQANAAVASAQKSVSQAKQNKQELEETLRTLREVTIPLNVQTVSDTVNQAKANVTTAQSDYNRQRQLQGLGYVAQSDVETSYSKLATNKAALNTALQRQKTLQRENNLSISELQARVNQAQAGIEVSQSNEEQARASLQLAQENSYQDKVRQQEYEAAQAAVKQAQADLDVAIAQRKQVAVKQQDIAAAAEQIKRVRATQVQAQTNLSYTRVTAPRDGVVVTKNVEEGTVVPSSKASIGSTNALIQIGDTSRLWVVCQVDETDIGQVKQYQRVRVRVDAYPDEKVFGKVIRIDPQAIVTQNVTTIPVTVELAKPDPRFKPTMNATCEFISAEAHNVVTVPNEAVKERKGKFTVAVMQPNGKPKDVDVEVGLAGQDTTEIKSGVNDGDEVVTKVIEPEKPQTNNPFGGPFQGRPNGNRGGGAGGGRGGGGGGGGGGSRGGGGGR